jgi:hypothetical protein
MDIKAYIESGILEQFVLGNTSPEETQQVIDLSKTYPEIKSEITAIEEGLISFAVSNAVKPSEDLKNKILNKISNEDPVVSEIKETKAIPMTPVRSVKMSLFMMAASLILLGVSIIGNVWLYQKWNNTKMELSSLNLRNNLLVENDKVQQAKYAEIDSKLQLLTNPQVKSVRLKGLPSMPQALATIYWDTNKREVYLNASQLQTLAENEQYQLWAIVDGKPVDAGVFVTEEASKGIVKMKDASNATAFAITIEKKGGSLAPTLEKMVLMGAVI